jgi:WhiB family redox-sensing transcriptional regulator
MSQEGASAAMSTVTSTTESRWSAPPPMRWRDRAACLEEDPELFFPIGAKEPAMLQVEEAKQVCARCPVDSECLSWALANREEYGVWGGLSEDERRSLRPAGRRRRSGLAA